MSSVNVKTSELSKVVHGMNDRGEPDCGGRFKPERLVPTEDPINCGKCVPRASTPTPEPHNLPEPEPTSAPEPSADAWAVLFEFGEESIQVEVPAEEATTPGEAHALASRYLSATVTRSWVMS